MVTVLYAYGMAQLVDGVVRVSASDTAHGDRCRRRVALDRDVALGRIDRPQRTDPLAEMYAGKGLDHEAVVLAALEAKHGPAVTIPNPAGDPAAVEAAAAATAQAMNDGAPLIYQAVFATRLRRGSPDFLVRVDDSRSSPTGWSYEPADAKLAASPAAEHLIQLGCYCLDVAGAQSLPPRNAYLLGGGGNTHTFDAESLMAAAAVAFERTASIANSPTDTYEPTPSGLCRLCPFIDGCDARMAETGSVLVLRPHTNTARRLTAAGVATLADLDAHDDAPVPGVNPRTVADLTVRARLRLAAAEAGRPVVLVTDPTPITSLPAVDPADLHVDFEGFPDGPDGQLEYLIGVWHNGTHTRLWAHNPAEEAASFAALLDLVERTLGENPQAHLYHYANYERAALKALADRHGHAERVEAILTRCVDLYTVTRSSLRTSHGRLGLKALEGFYAPSRSGAVADGGSSIVAYHHYLTVGDPQTLADLGDYNEADCRSLVDLRAWLDGLAA